MMKSNVFPGHDFCVNRYLNLLVFFFLLFQSCRFFHSDDADGDDTDIVGAARNVAFHAVELANANNPSNPKRQIRGKFSSSSLHIHDCQCVLMVCVWYIANGSKNLVCQCCWIMFFPVLFCDIYQLRSFASFDASWFRPTT